MAIGLRDFSEHRSHSPQEQQLAIKPRIPPGPLCPLHPRKLMLKPASENCTDNPAKEPDGAKSEDKTDDDS